MEVADRQCPIARTDRPTEIPWAARYQLSTFDLQSNCWMVLEMQASKTSGATQTCLMWDGRKRGVGAIVAFENFRQYRRYFKTEKLGINAALESKLPVSWLSFPWQLLGQVW